MTARPARAWLLLVIAGLVAGGIGWWLVNRYEQPFAPPEEQQKLAGKRMATIPLTAEEDARLAELDSLQERKNAAANTAALGLSLAAVVGLAAGLVGRSAAAAFAGLLGGAVAGAAFGAGGGWLAALVYQQLKIGLGLDRSYAAVASHAVTWVSLGIAAAFAAWPGVRKAGVSLGRTAGAATIGALIAAALYPVVAAVAFAMNNSDLILPSGEWNRLAWIETAAVAITFAVARAALRGRAAVPVTTAVDG